MTSSTAVTTDTAVDQQDSEGQKKYRLSREARARFQNSLPKTFRVSDAVQYFNSLKSDSEKLDFFFYLMVERRIGPDEIGSDLTAAAWAISREHVVLCKARLARRLRNTHK